MQSLKIMRAALSDSKGYNSMMSYLKESLNSIGREKSDIVRDSLEALKKLENKHV